MSGGIALMKLPVTRCPQLQPSEHVNSFRRGMFKLKAKCDADSLLYPLSHSECDGHTVHVLTQWCLLPPLTSTVKSSLFTRAHPSPLSLAARSHRFAQMVLIILIMAGLFLDRARIFLHTSGMLCILQCFRAFSSP